MVIGDHQAMDRLIQTLRRGQFKPRTALFQNHGIVRQHIARLVGRMAFIHVADHSSIQSRPRLRIDLWIGQGIFRFK